MRREDFPREGRVFLTFLSSLYETLLASPRLVVPVATRDPSSRTSR